VIYNNSFIRFFNRLSISIPPATPFLENITAVSNFGFGVREGETSDFGITLGNNSESFNVGFVNGSLNNFLGSSFYDELSSQGEVFVESIYDQTTQTSFNLDPVNPPVIVFDQASFPYFDLSGDNFISGFNTTLTNDFTIIFNQQSIGNLTLFSNTDSSVVLSVVDDRLNLIAPGFDVTSTAPLFDRQSFSDIFIIRTGNDLTFFNSGFSLGTFNFTLSSFDINLLGNSTGSFFLTEFFTFDTALSTTDLNAYQDNSLSSDSADLNFEEQSFGILLPSYPQLNFEEQDSDILFPVYPTLTFTEQDINAL